MAAPRDSYWPNGPSSRSKRSRCTGGSHTVITVRWDGFTHPLGKTSFYSTSVQVWTVALGHAHSAVHKYHNRLAWVTDSVVGLFISLEMFSILGIRILFLDRQLFDSRNRRSASSSHVANFGCGREWHWRTDGWTLRRLHLCGYHSARCARGTVLPRTRLAAWTRTIDGRRTGVSRFRTGGKR
jgi:hypothetical protein